MYFPYFRGRQYELLALKEIAAHNLINNNVVPVIEPVKLIPALNNALAAFNAANLTLGLILNPNVGDLSDEPETIENLLEILFLNKNIIPSVLMNESTEEVMCKLQNNAITNDKLLVVLNDHDYIDTYRTTFTSLPKYTLCPDDGSIRRAAGKNKVVFENKFKKRSRNADYPQDEFFSDAHLYYESDNYIGFGDYSIIGDEYIESGFAPYAVAIHIVYFDRNQNLRIRHFVSDSNEDVSDVAGKFYEAVTKLDKWYNDNNMQSQQTKGLKTLLAHYTNRTYPGLPTLKKLSIMHHLELLNKYLDRSLKI